MGSFERRNKMICSVNFRCYMTSAEPYDHYRTIDTNDIDRWIEAYQFTHPNCTSITVKIWLKSDTDTTANKDNT